MVGWQEEQVDGDAPARVLILGGTAEARQLAEALAARGDVEVLTSLAGRTRDPLLPPGEVRRGGFGGAEGLAAFLHASRPTAVVDATHPYAEVISRNARRACAALGIPRLRLERPVWMPEIGDEWKEAANLADALRIAATIGTRVFLSAGRVDMNLLAGWPKLAFLVRTIEPVADPPANVTAIEGRGPFTVEGEQKLLKRHKIQVIVSKASGGEATFAKILAARALKLPVVMLRRPPPPGGAMVGEVPAALAWVDQLLLARRARRST
jgi:precorrin-6A/cobalt-precorrin-6A reductase